VRCVGDCCRGFYLPASYAELLAQPGRYEDATRIAAAFVPTWSVLDLYELEPGEQLRKYNCRHLQPNGDCGIYHSPERPEVCREHGVAYACSRSGCPLPRIDDALPETWCRRIRMYWDVRRKPQTREWLREVVAYIRTLRTAAASASDTSTSTLAPLCSDTDRIADSSLA
jgi:hypothetical protein